MNKNEFIEKSNLVHNGKYIYDNVPNEFKVNDNVNIICPEHGEFVQCARAHYRGHGCPKCGHNNLRESLRYDTDVFIMKLKNKFPEIPYDTSLIDYKGNKTNVKLICPIHGPFEKSPHELMKGKGCPKCAHINAGHKNRLSEKEVLERFVKIHNGKYRYDKFIYTTMFTKSIITCPKHGDFEQKPIKHISGEGCPLCGYENNSESFRKSFDVFLSEARAKFKDKFQYDSSTYLNMHTKMRIICPTHGELWMTPLSHIKSKTGCEMCSYDTVKSSTTITTDEFIERSRVIHKGKYDYSKTKYYRSKSPVEIICPKHGSFFQLPNFHLMGSGCPKCVSPISKWENELYEYIISLGILCEQSNRTVLNGSEIDILLSDYNIGIECDGLRWHNEQYRDKDYHLNKTIECADKGIRLIHVFEDEWINKKDIIKSMLSNILHKTENRIYARECTIKKVNANDRAQFLNENHIQGDVNSKFNYGLYYKDELVSIMTFGHNRINLGGKAEENKYELIRFCNKIRTNVVGAASKLFKEFLKDKVPNEIVSYSDRRWSLGNLYTVLGFKHHHNSKPNYFYVVNQKRENRFKYRKDLLVKDGFDKNKTEHQIMLDRKIYRIYDCGNMVWKWTNPQFF